ncbi:hypothetical protein VaNZ11_008454 [Volvox africanus]|uniref:Protein SPT2 homolog n=1 Tax=Volvox africanus TaxID=51714 RepID=A0ABQ5S5C3_9CHLO|nr:hypothetical protein VaNZ11_008454 [Volvox africanus]
MGVIGDMAGGEVLRSFFGGPVSTRAICAVVVPKDEPDPPPAALKHRDKYSGSGTGSATGSKGVAGAPLAPRPKPIDPKLVRKKQIQADLDLFEDLATDGPSKLAKPKPKPVVQDLPPAAGPGPSSARLNSASKLASTAAAGGNGKTAGLGVSSTPARGKAPSGISASKPGGQQAGQRAVGTAAVVAKARPGTPAAATNGIGSRVAPTNHQRQGTAATTGGKTGSGATASGRPSQLQAAGGRSGVPGVGTSTSGRPAGGVAGGFAATRPGAAASNMPSAAKGIAGSGAARAGPASGTGESAVRPAVMRRPGEQPRSSAGGPGGLRHGGGGGGGGSMRKPAPRRPRDDEYDEYDDDFVVHDEEEGQDWRKFLRRTTGYDPSRYQDDPFDDRMMEASWRQVVAEEKRSERMGRLEDEMAEEEEERHRKEKLKKLKLAKKQRTD